MSFCDILLQGYNTVLGMAGDAWDYADGEEVAPLLTPTKSPEPSANHITRSSFMYWATEPWEYVSLFWADWITSMTAGLSLISPFANVIADVFRLSHPIPETVLVIVSALAFACASFRVWRAERRRRLAVSLKNLLVLLEEARKGWKKHEHDCGKIGKPYFPFSGPPSFEGWTVQNFEEHKDKIVMSEKFYSYARAAHSAFAALGYSTLTPLSDALWGPPRYNINGNQLDELIREDFQTISAKIGDVHRGRAKAWQDNVSVHLF